VHKRWLCALVLAFTTAAFADPMPPLGTVFVIVLENHNWSEVKGNTNAPYINNVLLPSASYCEQYYNPPDRHPSIRNYIWLEAGTDFGITSNVSPFTAHQSTTNHLVSQLQAAGISWKTYQEDIDGYKMPLTDVSGYVVRHNPFMYFDDVTGTNNLNYSYGVSHVRPYSEFDYDLNYDGIARYNFITPNLCDDGHNLCYPFESRLAQTDAWLATEIPRILSSPAYEHDSAIFITWDEGNGGDGPIGMILLSPLARGGGYASNIHYTHSSLLRSLQETFHVGPLLNDATNATNLSDLFKPLSIASAAFQANGFQLNFCGVIPGTTNIVEASSNFVDWTPLETNVSYSTEFTTVDSNATNSPRQFYRLRQVH
jgi:phosphatidylinositol-3-phosphatase